MTKILIIEDNQDNLELMVYLLNHYGYATIAALDGEKGVALVKQEMPDLIICDIRLPKLNGYDIAQLLKNDPELKQIPLIAVTAYSMVGDRDKIRAAGFDAYIAKPIDPAQFVTQLETLLPTKLRSNKYFNVKSDSAPEKILKEGSALVVADFIKNRELSKSLLESIGFNVIAVKNVKEA